MKQVLCVVHATGSLRRSRCCGLFDDEQLEHIPSCETDLTLKPASPPLVNTVIAVRVSRDVKAARRVTLALPPRPDPFKPYRISNKVDGNPTTVIPCDRLPTKSLWSKKGQCALAVYCHDPEKDINSWVPCLANLAAGSLAQCRQEPPPGTELCKLADHFKKVETWPVETEPATYSAEEVGAWLRELDSC